MTAAAIVHARLMAFMAFRARKCSLMLAMGIDLISAVRLFNHGLVIAVTRSANIQITAGFEFDAFPHRHPRYNIALPLPVLFL